jgi:hypothetical protein
MMNKFWSISLSLLCCGCNISTETEKYQSSRNNIINVRDRVVEIVIDAPLIGSNSRLYLIDDYLIIKDFGAFDELIHLFDRSSFTYVTSIANRGQGPGEIANIGYIAVDEARRKFYVPDHGKNKIFSYDLDSVLNHSPSYMPDVKLEMTDTLYTWQWQVLNDSIAFCRIIQPIGNNNFKPTAGKRNMLTGEITLMPYENPRITGRKRSTPVASPEHGIYVEYYHNHDLMTICNLDGDLICNIYGPDWSEDVNPNFDYYTKAIFCGDRIYAKYSGEYIINEKGQSNWPTRFHVFDLRGDYIQTLETGMRIVDFCYDKGNNRLIICFDDEMQFGYLELD